MNYFSIYIYIAYIEFESLLVEIHSSNLYLMNQEYSSTNYVGTELGYSACQL